MLFVKNIMLYSLFITSSSYLISNYDWQVDPIMHIEEEIFPFEQSSDFIVEVKFYTDDMEIDNHHDDLDDKHNSITISTIQNDQVNEIKNIDVDGKSIIEEDDIIDEVPHELINCVKKLNKEKKKLEKKERKEKYKLFKKSQKVKNR